MALGIDNLKKFILVFIEAGMVVEDILGDGKVSVVEGLQAGVKLSPEIMTLLNLDYLLLTKEWMDLDAAETAALNAFVAGELVLDAKAAEKFIEQAFSIGIEVSIMARKVYAMFKGVKDAKAA